MHFTAEGAAMQTKLSAAAAIVVAAVVLTGVATAGHAAAQQRVAITSPGGNSGAFVLKPLTSGPIKRDSGTATACCWTRRVLRRDGQSIEIDDPLRTFEGNRGTFAWRARIEFVDLEKGYSIGTGTWKIVRGTGSYAHLEGHGRVALITDATGQSVADRAEGLVDLRR
jgi:hypothetical protein